MKKKSLRMSASIRLLIGALSAVALVNELTIPAQAAPSQVPSRTFAAGTTRTLNPQQGTPDVIPCEYDAQYPHNSSHYPGTINAIITVQCSAIVARIVGTMSLYRDGKFVAPGSVDVTNKAKTQMNAATESCIPGSYYSEGIVSIYFPEGYSPPSSLNNEMTSPTVKVTCPEPGQ
jgi:hypothetical protein